MSVVHRDTPRRGREALALQEANSTNEGVSCSVKRTLQYIAQSEENENALAQAVQAALDKSGKSW